MRTRTTDDFDTDPRYRTSSIGHYKTGTPDVELATIGYPTRDKVGNPESITDWTGAWTYGYDANNRLDWALAPNFAASGDPTRPVPGQPAGGDYEYDWVGNRVRPPADPAPVSDINKMVYNDADQLLMWPGRHGHWNGSTLVPGYVYDNAGNLTAVKDVYGSSTLASYNYTDAGLLNQAQYGYDPATQTWRTLTSTWDADSNRIGMNANGTAYAFVHDTTAGIPAVIEEHTETNTTYYIREPGGELIARVHPTEGIRYYHFDELGSTRLLTDGSGTVTDRYAYDAYGALLAYDRLTGSVDQPYQYVGRLGYYTHWMEPEFALLQLGVRFYDAQVGRFGQRDGLSIWGVSPFNYAFGSPLSLLDPTGYLPVKTCLDNWPSEADERIKKLLKDLAKKSLSSDELVKILIKQLKGTALATACEVVACMFEPTPGQGTQSPVKPLGYPCSDKGAKVEHNMCMRCMNWHYNQCLCKEAKNPILAPVKCLNASKIESLKCSRLPCGNNRS